MPDNVFLGRAARLSGGYPRAERLLGGYQLYLPQLKLGAVEIHA